MDLTGFAPSAIVAQAAGVVGIGGYLAGYAAVQFGFIRGQGYLYPAVNLVAAAAVLISLAHTFNLASAIIQICWMIISLIGIARIFILSRTVPFSEEEKAFLSNKLPNLPAHTARRFLDCGTWCDLGSGTLLTREGQPVDRLVYIASGQAEVRLGERRVGMVANDSLVGEITVVTGESATATARLTESSRCFCIDGLQVRRLMERDAQIGSAIERVVATEMQKKIEAMNRAGASA